MKENHQFPREVLEYILQHENTDPYSLALQSSPFSKVSMKTLVQQIQGRRIAKRKFPFLLSFEQYRYPAKESLEQASSEATATFKSKLIEGKSFVDLTGGMGIDTFLLGRDFQDCMYIEPNRELFELTSQNFRTLGFDQCTTSNINCESFLESNKEKYDWAYIDPSRRIGGQRRTSIFNYEPNMVELEPALLQMADNVLVKLSPMQDISECMVVLKNIQKIWVISVQNEVKELLFHLKKNSNRKPLVSAIDLRKEVESSFSYVFEDRNCTIKVSEPLKYIYQPGASIIKAELQNKYANSIGISKLHANTHLYTSDKRIENYLGKAFEVKERLNLNKKEIRKALPQMRANVIAKNFPLNSVEIVRKFKLKDGGNLFLIAYTGHDNLKRVVLCNRIMS